MHRTLRIIDLASATTLLGAKILMTESYWEEYIMLLGIKDKNSSTDFLLTLADPHLCQMPGFESERIPIKRLAHGWTSGFHL